VLGIQAELVKRSANFVRYRGVPGSSRPAIAAAGMLELQIAAILKVEHGLSECSVHNIPRGLSFGEISKHVERRQAPSIEVSVTKSARGSQYI
jgi:hypothetical protein